MRINTNPFVEYTEEVYSHLPKDAKEGFYEIGYTLMVNAYLCACYFDNVPAATCARTIRDKWNIEE